MKATKELAKQTAAKKSIPWGLTSLSDMKNLPFLTPYNFLSSTEF
jgi:hypothetical protein